MCHSAGSSVTEIENETTFYVMAYSLTDFLYFRFFHIAAAAADGGDWYCPNDDKEEACN